jgi:hypothetical protein
MNFKRLPLYLYTTWYLWKLLCFHIRYPRNRRVLSVNFVIFLYSHLYMIKVTKTVTH